MSTARPKRNRARVDYVEPTELDDDIAVEEDHVEPEAAAEPAEDQSSGSDISDDDSDCDEYTTDKRKAKAQEMALKKKKAAKKAKKAKKAKEIKDVPFPFMELPPEIRVMIYKEVLVESARELTFVSKNNVRNITRGCLLKKRTHWGGIRYKYKREKVYEPKRTSLQPVLLCVCKAIGDETLPFFYGQTFYFENPNTLQVFLARISPLNRMLLRNIVLRGWLERSTPRKDVYQVFALLTSATNIRSLLLDRRVYDKADSDFGNYSPLKFWQDIEHWADAVDGVHGKGAAKKILQFTKICFGTQHEIDIGNKDLDKREQDFLSQLKFSDKPADKPAQAPTDVAGTGKEASNGSDK